MNIIKGADIIKNRLKLFLDFDNTLTNTTKAFIDIYVKKLKRKIENKNNFTKPNWTKIRKWNFSDECPNITGKEIDEIFNNKNFFNVLQFYPQMSSFLNQILINDQKVFETYIVSKGSNFNRFYKEKWILNNIPNINPNNIKLIDNKNGMDKSSVNMLNGIIVDDHQDCLLTSNAKWKILFTYNNIKTEWNEKVYNKMLQAYDTKSLKIILHNIALVEGLIK